MTAYVRSHENINHVRNELSVHASFGICMLKNTLEVRTNRISTRS
jgi:uncharacterized protein (DUF486 family)